MKITFLGLKPKEKAFLEKQIETFKDHELVLSELADVFEAPKETEILSVFVGTVLTGDDLKHFPDLKMIATRSTGFDHIDLAYCKKKKIAVCNVPSYGSHTVAEFTFALLLTLSRKIYTAYDQVKEDGNFMPDKLEGFDLHEKTLGVIGTGKIGRNVVRIAQGFGMNVVMFDPYPDGNFRKETGFEYFPLEQVLASSDIITLHVPYMESTHHLLDELKLRKMKKGSYIVNTSRGPIIDTEALLKVLKEGHLGGAALDVLEEETLIFDEANALIFGDLSGHDLKDVIANHALIDMPNVIVTPHIAYNSKEANKRILDTTVENITKFIEGKVVNTV